jgi:hypothetical protein
MRVLVPLFWGMVFGRQGPRDVPATPRCLALCALAYLITSVAQAIMLTGVDSALVQGLADLLLTAVLVTLCLQVGHRSHRLLQTLSAVFGVGALLSIPMLVLLGLRPAVTDAVFANLLSILSLPLIVWSLVVFASILRQALDATWWLGMGLSLGYFVISYLALDQLSRVLGA